jgi:hypothetical protein
MHTDRANSQSTRLIDLSLIDSICDSFESTWRSGSRPKIEDYLSQVEEASASQLLVELILLEFNLRRDSGDVPKIEEYVARFPEHEALLREKFSEIQLATVDATGASRSFAIELRPGELFGRYQLLSPLGRGGFGEVWRARDPVLNREVALKTLRVDKSAHPELNHNLVKEGQHLARLSHEHIVKVLDAGISGGRAFLVSELKEGGTLAKRIKEGPPIERDTAVRWVLDMARALQSAHEQGFIHRDLKPGNILFDAKGNICVADFGLAASEYEQLGEPSGMMGTWAYAPPEQIRGDARLADPRSDIYSLGVMFYQLLTGRLPYVAQTSEQYKQQVLEREPRPLRSINAEIPSELEQLCLQCLRKEISQRPGSAQEIVESLQRWIEHQAQQPDSTVTKSSDQKGTTAIWWAAALALAAVTAAFAIPGMLRDDDSGLGANQGVGTGPADDGLNWRNPEVIVWGARNVEVDEHFFDADREWYEFDAEAQSLFKAGICETDVLTLDTTIQFDGPTGTAGVFWGLNRVVDERFDQQCWCIQVGQLTEAVENVTAVREYGIAILAGHPKVMADLYVTHFDRESTNDTIRLQVRVDATSIQEITVNGKSLLTEPIELPKRDWYLLKDSGYGFTGHGGTFYVEAFSAE